MPSTPNWVDYRAQLTRVTAHIHDHLAEPLDLAELAVVADLSPYHWHRVYHALIGETVAATVRRVRLHRASGYLAQTALTVTEIARRCGYPNAQSFTRAFRQRFGQSPQAWRDTRTDDLPWQDANPQPARGWPVEVRYVPIIELAGMPHRGSYMRIGKAFESSQIHLAAQGLMRQDTRWVGQYHDDPFAYPEAQLNSRAGLSLPPGAQVEPPLQRFTAGGTPCAVLRYQGPYPNMRDAYRWLYGTWLVASGHALADQPVFEEYHNNPRTSSPADLLTDICLPLAASTGSGAV
ncbi:AraC family transcriptional regulator [Hydrogenophaga palleronii]|uniref:AraC family transcriptional regulator n=1 Tax=Hydrogenophaga palleronii TaxID=65655 RepID=A0ABU1WHL0_9BURK|nr:AraC family transcriptional regulator [Hydrogenophaga palleronii]MDR7148751.1 AraC family transcriptional regulator [Hydrogenophaga palleronii]